MPGVRYPPASASNTLGKRSRRWAQKGSWQRLFAAEQEPDLAWVLLESTVGRAQAAGSRKKAVSGTKRLALVAAV